MMCEAMCGARLNSKRRKAELGDHYQFSDVSYRYPARVGYGFDAGSTVLYGHEKKGG